MNNSTIVVATDNGVVSWTYARSHTGEGHDNSQLILGGWLFGKTRLVNEVRDILSDKSIESVPVNWSRYVFSESRDTKADLVAAMYSIGNGRATLNDNGWDVLNEAMPELTDPENNDPDVIY